MALLSTHELSKSFGSVVAADRITVSIEEREVIGVIGANGAGKTTFVNMVTGYLKPTNGRIFYQGQDITPLSPREITHLGICRSFQVPQVFMSLSTFDNLMIALGVVQKGVIPLLRPLRRKELIDAAGSILDRYDIAEYRDREAGLLPQGVRKLLDIAMAMVHKPKLVLLDEPTSGVSVSEKYGIMDVVMNALKDLGITVMFIEHDMDIVERYSRRVLAFYDGAIVADGTPDKVLENEKVREFVIGEEIHRKGRKKAGAKNA